MWSGFIRDADNSTEFVRLLILTGHLEVIGWSV
jgi:hypothetical protein